MAGRGDTNVRAVRLAGGCLGMESVEEIAGALGGKAGTQALSRGPGMGVVGEDAPAPEVFCDAAEAGLAARRPSLSRGASITCCPEAGLASRRPSLSRGASVTCCPEARDNLSDLAWYSTGMVCGWINMDLVQALHLRVKQV
jgi:hypothetical protein